MMLSHLSGEFKNECSLLQKKKVLQSAPLFSMFLQRSNISVMTTISLLLSKCIFIYCELQKNNIGVPKI